jgi:hypothetical protein
MIPAAMGFTGGSAYAMARDVAEGYTGLNERSLKALSEAELGQLAFELDRYLRELRGLQPPLDDIAAIQHKNRRIGRLNGALTLLRARRQARR